MKRFGVVAVIAAVALVMGVSGFGRTTIVKADPTDIIALNPVLVNALATDATCFGACDLSGADSADVLDVADAVGDGDGVVEPEDFADIDLDGDQIMAGTTATLWVLTFVDDDKNVIVDASIDLNIVEAAAADLDCGVDIGDEDCNDDAVAGDGVVVATIEDAGTADAGETENVEAEQDLEEVSMDINIVGEPDEITVTALETDISEAPAGAAACDTLDIADFDDLIENTDIAGLIAEVVDNDGTALAAVAVSWESDDEDVVDLQTGAGVGYGLTLALDAGTVALNLACGDGPGSADVEGANASGLGDPESEIVTINVFGAPADIVASASPATIACDGVAGSTVTATVTDSDGNPVVDGTPVRFDVFALGTADPIVNGTVAGDASSTITPLSGLTAGVSVLISSGDAETSVLIGCEELAPPPPPPPPPPDEPGIVPPPTGTGGYLGQDAAGGFGWLALAGLAMGGLALTIGSVALRRYVR